MPGDAFEVFLREVFVFVQVPDGAASILEEDEDLFSEAAIAEPGALICRDVLFEMVERDVGVLNGAWNCLKIGRGAVTLI